jgi:hypothetical protein
MTDDNGHFEYRVGFVAFGRDFLPCTGITSSEEEARRQFELSKQHEQHEQALRPGDRVLLLRRPLGPWQTVDEWTVPAAAEGGG